MAKTGKLMSPNFRVAWPHVFDFDPFELESGKQKYTMEMLFEMDKIEKDEAQRKLFDDLTAAIKGVVKEEWGDDIPKNLHIPLKDGTERGYEGNIKCCKVKSKEKPGIVDSDVKDIIDRNDFYAGCYARATINIFTYNYKNANMGVGIGLNHIQKISDGEPLTGGRTKAANDFSAVSDTAFSENDLDDMFK